MADIKRIDFFGTNKHFKIKRTNFIIMVQNFYLALTLILTMVHTIKSPADGQTITYQDNIWQDHY